MTNRYKPNEATCPVPVEMLALLLRTNEAKVGETVAALSDLQRAALAAFCFQRSHLRALGLLIASHCPEEALRKAAGAVGELLFEQSRTKSAFDTGPASTYKRTITLARAAAA